MWGSDPSDLIAEGAPNKSPGSFEALELRERKAGKAGNRRVLMAESGGESVFESPRPDPLAGGISDVDGFC